MDDEISSNCLICKVNQFKYTCPGCDLKTCSLKCYNLHKVEFSCSGKINSNKYIKRSDLNQIHLNRDYNFLLNVDRKIQISKEDLDKQHSRNILKRTRNENGQNKRFKYNIDDKRVKLVLKRFRASFQIKRENTLIINLPQGMQRSISNKTGYDKKLNSFVWTVEWIILNDKGDESYKFISYKIKEGNILKDAIPLNILAKHALHLNKDELQLYLKNVFDKDEMILINRNETVSKILKDKIVLEYPTIYVTASNESLKNRIINEEDAYNIDNSGESSSDETSSDSDSDSNSDSSESSDSSSNSSSDDEDDDDDDSGPEESSSKPIIPQNTNIETNINDPNEINLDDID
ncbi:unnamed protein product [Candida verbasci]|uniref:HIT-type domain-containing protein n=1 Tax=Candida verbasci TaxID=1227364 RepID=A0A9W4TVV5_9ASCO|nr:unnamed protein product [Candida verbasci]